MLLDQEHPPPSKIDKPGVSSARTWSDLKRDFPEVSYLEIADQNANFQSEGWNWLDGSSDPVFIEARELMETSGKKNDLSDAGMLYYALTGKEEANPWSAKEFLETNWSRSSDDSGVSALAVGEKEKEYSIDIEYSVESKWNDEFTTKVSFRNNGEAFEGWEIELDADIEIRDVENAEIIFHGGDRYVIGDVSWNDNVYEGEVTSFTMTSKSQPSKIENWEFNGEKLEDWEVKSEVDISVNQMAVAIDNNDWRIEAEDMQLSTYKVEENDVASGNELISLRGGDNDDTGTANFEFSGGTGEYNIIIDAFDENDGEGEIKLTQNGEFLESFVLDEDRGSAMADEKTATALEIKDVLVSSGDKFVITGIEDGGESTAEHGRIDRVEFVPINVGN